MPNADTHDNTRSAARVRQNAGSAAIAAALMIYFGFFRLLEPSGSDLFQRAGWVFYHTLRIGGIVMGLVGAWSLLGHRPVLLVDAAASIIIGALLILTGAAMGIDGGDLLQTVFMIVFGIMFISAGVRSARTYADLRAAPDAESAGHAVEPVEPSTDSE